MKLLITIMVALMLGTGFSSLNNEASTISAPIQFQQVMMEKTHQSEA